MRIKFNWDEFLQFVFINYSIYRGSTYPILYAEFFITNFFLS